MLHYGRERARASECPGEEGAPLIYIYRHDDPVAYRERLLLGLQTDSKVIHFAFLISMRHTHAASLYTVLGGIYRPALRECARELKQFQLWITWIASLDSHLSRSVCVIIYVALRVQQTYFRQAEINFRKKALLVEKLFAHLSKLGYCVSVRVVYMYICRSLPMSVIICSCETLRAAGAFVAEHDHFSSSTLKPTINRN